MSNLDDAQKRRAPLVRLGELLERAYRDGRLALDLRGHCRHRGLMSAAQFEEKLGEPDIFSSLYFFDKPGCPTEEQAFALLSWLNREPGAEPVYGFSLEHMLVGLRMRRCGVCGNYLVEDAVLNGNVITTGNPCPHPRGHGPVKLKLWVPSGYMVVENDLRDLFPTVEPEASINYETGIVLTSKAYEVVGMAHGFVGNTCPSMYRQNAGSFTLGGKARGKKVASVCTDLWWYSIVDRDEYLTHLDPEWKTQGAERAKELLGNTCVVKCRPGLYEVKHQFHQIRDDGEPYAVIQWKAERPKRLPDYRKAYMRHNFTAGQILSRHAEDYPTLYKQRCRTSMDREPCTVQESMAMVAHHTLLMGGTGNRYHPNGWAGGTYEMCRRPPEDVEIPRFDRPLPYCSDFSDFSFLAVAVGLGNEVCKKINGVKTDTLYLNPSFVDLSFNFLHALLVYGVDPMLPGDEEHAAQRWESSIDMAGKCCVRLAEQYPDAVPQYCREVLAALQSGNYQIPVLTFLPGALTRK